MYMCAVKFPDESEDICEESWVIAAVHLDAIPITWEELEAESVIDNNTNGKLLMYRGRPVIPDILRKHQFLVFGL